MTNDKLISDCLKDTILILKELALDARKEELMNPEDSFLMGEVITFARVISLFQQQATIFGIPLKDINLHDIDPDGDLQGLKKSEK